MHRTLTHFRRRGIIITGLLVFAIMLASCVEVAFESEFEDDGSAVHSITSTFNRSLMDDQLFGEAELEEGLDFDEIERQAEAAGFEVERIDTPERIGVRVSYFSDDNEDLGAVLNEMFNVMGESDDQLTAFSGSFTERGGGLSATTFHFELTVDGSQLFDQGEDEFEDDVDIDLGMDMMRQFLNLTYTVAMPGEITEHNGNVIGAGRVQWELPIQETITFEATSEEGSSFPLILIIGVIVGSIAVILLVVGGVILMRGNSGPPAETAHDPSADATHEDR